MNAFRSAVVPAAGLGTRFLPTTKTVPKELLPVVDTPGIELVAAEAAAAGAEELLIVTSPGKDAVAAHFADSSELEKTLAARGKEKLVAKVRRAHELINARTVTQTEPLGLGHAVGCAREEISAYGVFDVSDTDDEDVKQVHGMVEKPAADEAPSTFAAAGRYLLDVAIFEALDRITPGAGGELQLTDAVQLLISEGHPVHVVVHRGGRHDLGNPGSYVRAFVDYALENPEYGPELRAWLVERLER